MRKTFIETGEFTEWFRDHLTDDDLDAMQRGLLVDPEQGDVMPGCGGLRKLRIADPRRGKGKRSGARVIYLHIEEADEIHLITVYDKDQKDDLTAEDKKLFRQFVQILKRSPGNPRSVGERAKAPSKRLSVADQIRKGLTESIGHARGEITLKTTVVKIPDRPPEVQPEELTKLRTRSSDVPGHIRPRAQCPHPDRSELGRRDGEALPGCASAHPGFPPGHRRRPRSGRHDRRPGTRRPAEAAASGSVEVGHAAPTDDLRAGRGTPVRTRGCASVRTPGRLRPLSRLRLRPLSGSSPFPAPRGSRTRISTRTEGRASGRGRLFEE